MIQYKDFIIECAVEAAPQRSGEYQTRIFISMLEGGEPVNGFEFPPYPNAQIGTPGMARQGAEQWARTWIDENFAI